MLAAPQLAAGTSSPTTQFGSRAGRTFDRFTAGRRPPSGDGPNHDKTGQGCLHCRWPFSRRNVGCRAFAAQSGGRGSPASQQMSDRKRFLLKYVQEVKPNIMEQFVVNAPESVVDAMRQTITNMLGTLPPQFFAVTISTMGENLAQLMYSVMLSGYMFRNAYIRMELMQSMQPVLPAGEDPEDDTLQASARSLALAFQEGAHYEQGSQKTRVQGEVLRWHQTAGPEAIPAAQYIESLEQQVYLLKQQVAARMYLQASGNELLNYLKCLEPHSITELTSGAGDDVLEAMNTFIQRLLGTTDEDELRNNTSESNSTELSRLMFWLMVVGYTLRTMEIRFDMESTMLLPDPDMPGHSGTAPAR
ncbi:hypothetical protein WJX72_007962 [[Myrmecia] bisecta]|uniref:Uncharacterized protein n=1 Tax=[Myrmecia] bisecta TaxID=41462 RepID=A0AAW1R7S4_9CHLO